MKKILLSILTATALGAYAQNVNIPDANFKAYLVGNPGINTNGDGEIQLSEAQAFTGRIDCSGLLISDMTGIEAFLSLTELWCVTNQFTSLDVSQNTALIDLRCSSTDITSLDVSNNTALEVLHVQATDLSSIDVSQNTSLKELLCYSLGLTSLDVTNNTMLTKLYCEWNELTTLDVTNNTGLTHLSCALNQFTSIDVSQNENLIYLNCSSNDLGSLNLTQNTAMSVLYISDNSLASIDLSYNIALTKLRANTNQFSSIDLSENTALTELHLHENQLSTLDLSFNISLTDIRCSSNQLNSLNVANGNNTNVTSFFASSNPNLTCINVDDATWSTINWTNIDAGASFSENCTASVEEVEGNVKLEIYPNPTSNLFHIETTEKIEEITIVNQLGQVMLKTNLSEINIQDFPAGIYFVNVKTAHQQLTNRLIKQ